MTPHVRQRSKLALMLGLALSTAPVSTGCALMGLLTQLMGSGCAGMSGAPPPTGTGSTGSGAVSAFPGSTTPLLAAPPAPRSAPPPFPFQVQGERLPLADVTAVAGRS